MKNEPIYYGKLDTDDIEDMDYLITKMENETANL